MILRHIQESEQQSLDPSRCFPFLYLYLHRTSASVGRVHSKSHKWPALSLSCSSRPGPVESQSAAFNLFLSKCCHHVPVMQKRGSTLSLVLSAEYYAKKRYRIIILFPERGRSLDTVQTGPRVQNCTYNDTKRNKKACLWHFPRTPL